MLTHGPISTIFDEDDVTDVPAWDWWRASLENRRKASARVGEWSGRQEEKKEGRGGWGKARKKGGVGGGRTKKIREGWVGDDVIEKIKNKKMKK